MVYIYVIHISSSHREPKWFSTRLQELGHFIKTFSAFIFFYLKVINEVRVSAPPLPSSSRGYTTSCLFYSSHLEAGRQHYVRNVFLPLVVDLTPAFGGAFPVTSHILPRSLLMKILNKSIPHSTIMTWRISCS